MHKKITWFKIPYWSLFRWSLRALSVEDNKDTSGTNVDVENDVESDEKNDAENVKYIVLE